jgi:hypothetical protein
MTRGIGALLAALVLGPGFARAQRQVDYGIVLYDPPAGWASVDKDDLRTITAPDKTVVLIFLPSKPLAGTLDQAADEIQSEVRALPQYREESARTRSSHARSGGKLLTFAYSYADANRSGQFLYNWVILIAGGGRYATLSAVATSSAAFNTYMPIVGGLVDGISLTSTLQVEPGNPPLTRYMLEETVGFLEWLMQVPFTEAQRVTVETELRGTWQKTDGKEIDGVMEVLKERQQLATLKPAERDVVRQTALDDAIQQWRKDKDSPSAKLMIEIYENAHQPIAAGTPPLTRQNVDAFAEYLCFAAGQTAGIDYNPPPEIRDKLAASVAENYAHIVPAQRALIARMPLIWASLRVLWPEMSDAVRKQYADAWKKDPHLVALGKQLNGAAGKAQPATTSQITPVATHGSKATLAELQAKMAQQQATYTMMSNMMRMNYETSSTIIGNMGGGWTYEHRWR